MRARTLVVGAATVIAAVACKKTDDGNLVVDKPVGIQTQPDTLHPPTVTTKTDTINTPVVGTKPETLIVQKPVVGTQKTAVKVPVIQKKKP